MNYFGLKKSEIDAVNEKVAMMRGSQVTPYLVTRAERFIKNHFVEKGFYNTEVTIVQRDDTARVNHVMLDVHVDKKRSEEHTSELQSRPHLVCRLLLEKK